MNYKTHYNIRSSVLIEANKIPGVKLWQNPVGLGYMGEVVERYVRGGNSYIVLKNPRQAKFGLAKGSSDTIGFKTVNVGGSIIPRFCAIEIKTRNDTSRPEQKNFKKMIQQYGGIAGIARSSADAERILLQPLISTDYK